MSMSCRGIAARAVLVATATTALAAGTASANNLDRNTAQRALKQVAKRDCVQTTGCRGYKAEPVKLVTFHRANGKIRVFSEKNGSLFDCRRSVTLRLDHLSGKLTFSMGSRKCTNLGPASG